MDIIKNLKSRFDSVQCDFLIAIATIFLPFYITVVIHAIIFFKWIKQGEVKKGYEETKRSKYIIFFSALIFLTSVFYQNWPGAGVSLGYLMLYSMTLVYRRHASEELFDTMLNLVIGLSVFASVWAIIEYIFILRQFDLEGWYLVVFNAPQYRTNAMFFNANYYAMMIEFFVAICFYKFLKYTHNHGFMNHIKEIVIIGLITLLNLFCLYLTGCRTAWPALAGGLAIMLLFNRNYKSFGGICAVGAAGVGFFIAKPQYIPRMSNIVKYLGVRKHIWEVAIQNIKTHFLFGEGPMTYWHIYAQYSGHPTQHSHNIFIDPVLCFGIIGLLVIAPFFIENIKRLYRLLRTKCNPTLIALIVGYIVMIYIHGLLDYTIFFVSTGFLFAMIVSSFDIYRKEIDQ